MSALGELDPLGDTALSTLDPADFFSGRGARNIEDMARETQESSISELQRQFDISQGRLQPALDEAVPAIGLQAALAGAQGPEAQAMAMQGLQLSPDQQFAQEQSQRLINSGSAATGGLGGGDRLRSLTQLGTDFASQGLSNQFNRLGTVAGTGQNAGSGLAGLGSRFAQDVAGVNTAGTQGAIDAIQGAQQQRSSAVQTGIGALSALSDEAKKRDIKLLSHEECFNLMMKTPISVWKYLEECGIDDKYHFGPMYQEAPEEIKQDGEKALNIHDELWLIAGAMKHMHEVQKCQTA